MGRLLAFLYATTQHGFLGIRLSSWLKFLTLVLIFAAWVLRWSAIAFAATIALTATVRLLYWWAKRIGYIRFVPDNQTAPNEDTPELADEQRVAMQATGTFSVYNLDAYVLEKKAEYWRVPVGDHVLMVQHRPGRFLYEFIQAADLQQIQSGLLVFGAHPRKALAITFLSSWGSENGQGIAAYYVTNKAEQERKAQKTLYLTFEQEAEHQAVWRNLLQNK